MWPFLMGCQHNPSIFDMSVQGITCANVEPAAERTWQYDLPLGGHFGLHGKTILPYTLFGIKINTLRVTGSLSPECCDSHS